MVTQSNHNLGDTRTEKDDDQYTSDGGVSLAERSEKVQNANKLKK